MKGETMEFAEILQSLIPNASKATIEVGGAKITIEPSKPKAPEAPGPQDPQVQEVQPKEEAKPQIEGVSMEDIQLPTPKPKEARKPRVHREARKLHRDREHVYALVQGSGRSGMTSRDLVAAGVPISTVHSDLRWLVMQGRIMRSGDSYYTV